jgi:hypothetical protein
MGMMEITLKRAGSSGGMCGGYFGKYKGAAVVGCGDS